MNIRGFTAYLYLMFESLALLLGIFAIGNMVVLIARGYKHTWIFFSPIEDEGLWAISVLVAAAVAILIGLQKRYVALRIIGLAGYVVLGYGSELSAVQSPLEAFARLLGVVTVLLTSLRLVSSAVSRSDRVLGLSKATTLQALTVYFVSFLLPYELLALFHMLLAPLHLTWPKLADSATTEFVTQNLGLLAVPWLYLLMYASCIRFFLPEMSRVKILKKSVASLGASYQNGRPGTQFKFRDHQTDSIQPKKRLTRGVYCLIALATALLVTVFAANYPYMFKGFDRPLGQDVNEPKTGYLYVLQTIDEGGLKDFLTVERIRSGPLFYLLLYLGLRVSGLSPSGLLIIMPAFNAVFLVASTFCLVKIGYGSNVALLSAFFTGLSYTTTVGTYTGILSNWFALSLVAIALSFYIRSIKLRSSFNLLLAGAVSSSVLFVHPWTYALLLGVLFFCFVLSLSEGHRATDFDVRATSAILVASTILLILAMSAFGRHVGATISALQGFIVASVRPGLILDFWKALDYLVKLRFFSFFPLILFATIGAFVISVGERFQRVLAAWITASSLASVLISPFGLVSPTSQLTESFLWRSLFNMPFGVFAAIGLSSVFGRIGSEELHQSNKSRLSTDSILAFTIVGYMLVSAIILLTDLPKVIPLLIVNYLIATGVLILSHRLTYYRVGRWVFLMLVMLSLLNNALRSSLIAL